MERIIAQDSVIRRIIENFYEFFLIAIAVVVVFWFMSYQQQSRRLLVDQPQINDFYFVDYQAIDESSDKKYRYLPLKIIDVGEDNITFVAGASGHSEPVSISRHVKFDAPVRRNFFKRQKISIDKQQVLDWANDGVIYDIARPEKIYINGWIALSHRDILRAEQARSEMLAKS